PLEPLADYAAHLRQLLHQVRLGVQAAGRVDHDHVPPALLRRGDRVIGDGGGVAAALAADELGAGAPGPDLELLLGSRAERVRRADDDRAVMLAQPRCELADRGRLSRPIDADDEDDARAAVEAELRGLAEQRR